MGNRSDDVPDDNWRDRLPVYFDRRSADAKGLSAIGLNVIGLISGTSVDGIDAALVRLTGTDVDLRVELIRGATYAYPPLLREQILQVCAGASLSMAEWAALDDAIAHTFAQAALKIQATASSDSISPDSIQVELIGSHGQTVFHRPPTHPTQDAAMLQQQMGQFAAKPDTEHDLFTPSALGLGYTMQLGRGEAIAHLTGIPTVSNFRVADIAASGQGAPLVSRLDAYVLSHPEHSRCVQNIGGIGNVTYLPARSPDTDLNTWEQQILGWDTGPGNVLIDLAVAHFSDGRQTYDANGAWAATGQPCGELVHRWLQDEFFHLPPPKSTGREHFGVDYWRRCLADTTAYSLSPADVLATLTDFTAASIVQNYRAWLSTPPVEVLLCGGGSRNAHLRQRIATYLAHPEYLIHADLISQPSQTPPLANGETATSVKMSASPHVFTTDHVGLQADYKEAIAFAVLAYWRLLGIPGNLPAVTGAKQPLPLGMLHLPI